MYDFTLDRPTTIQDAVAALQSDEAQPLSGGQTLIPTMKARLAQADTLVALSGVAEMRGICTDDQGRLCIGGATPHVEVARETAQSYPALAYLAGHIGDPAVRARGTIGGSLANNDPSACYPAAALASGATIVATGPSGARDIAADDYFQGMFDTALDEGEIVTEVKFPVPQAAAYAKFVQPASRFALVAAFVAKFDNGVRVAITGASSDGVFRWAEAEEALTANFSPEALTNLAPPTQTMISDLHGPAEYRANLARTMTARAVKQS